MQINLEELLSDRILKHCLKLYENGYFKDAAREAMIQVEQALKEKGRVKGNLFGRNLVTALFKMGGKQKNIKLRVPLGDDLQEHAQMLFEGAFSYYRNYAAHDGSKIDGRISLRILTLASELLDLIDASQLSFADVGGIEGIVDAGGFGNKERLAKLLNALDGLYLPDGDVRDVLFDDGFIDLQVDAVFELNLVSYDEVPAVPTIEDLEDVNAGIFLKFISCCELTALGRQVIEEIEESKKENRIDPNEDEENGELH